MITNNFTKHWDIIILWIFITLFAVGIVATLYLEYIKLLVFCTIGLFALLKVLIAHETFLIMKGDA